MKTMLSENPNLEELKEWLIHNSSGRIIPQKEDLNNIPSKKGIYFWYLKKEAVNQLSKFEPIVVSKNLSYDEYTLVYIGTAGTGKSGGYDLRKRLEWHITQKHDINSICTKPTPILSTLRLSLSSLLFNDLIIDNNISVGDFLNKFFSDNFYVEYIVLNNSNIYSILNLESTLVNTIKPVFNLKKGRLSKEIINNKFSRKSSESCIKYRRFYVLTHTKTRLELNTLKNT